MEKILKKVYNKKGLCRLLRLISHFAGIFAFFLFAAVFALTLLNSPLGAIKLCFILLISYILVSLFRRMVNAPRPYELYGFYERKPKDKIGVSFPSRHTFLVFAIATLCFPTLPALSLVLFALGILLALSRVLLGIHFIRDVVCGALLGIISSALGLLILFS